MNRFAWLLRREWMQHHRGWLLLASVPLVLVLLVLPFATVNLGGNEAPPTLLLALLTSSGYTYVLMLLVASTMLFQAAGMARRDQQDRSIEFWLSLPISHTQSVLATLLMHVLLMPLLALLIVFVGSQLVAAAMVAKLSGAGALAGLADPAWLGYNAVALVRLVVGLLVSGLWIAPVVLGAMAAASWLKGWGVPALVGSTLALSLLVQQFTGSPVVLDTVKQWFTESLAALLPLSRGESQIKAALAQGRPGIEGFGDWMWGDLGQMLRDLATPAFAAAVVVAGIGFALVVLRRAGGPAVRWPWSR